MVRPPSIVRYGYCYLAATLLSAINTAITWKAVNASPEAAQASAVLGPWFMPLSTVFVFTLALTLWFFTAREPSRVAKWIVVALTVLRVAAFAAAAVGGLRPQGVPGALAVAGLGLSVIAVVLLFRRDSLVWFGRPR